MVKEIGFDLLRADKLASDINYRRLLNIVILYLVIFLLFVSICLMLYYKVKSRMFTPAPVVEEGPGIMSYFLPSFNSTKSITK